MKQPHSNKSSSGFTLIEIVLAVLVISLGLLVTFHLSRQGITSSRAAEGEIRATLFADNLFAGLSAVNNSINANSISNEFQTFWEDFANGNTNIPIAALPMWFSDPQDPSPGITCNGLTNTLYYLAPSEDPYIGTNITEYAFRYHIKVSITNRTSSVRWPDSAQVQLDVLPGSSGKGEWYTFVTLFADSGGLP